MSTRRAFALLRLAAALALGRARAALPRRLGAGGLISGALFHVATNALLVFAGLFYSWVAATLIGVLVERGGAEASAAAAGAHLELVLMLVLVTTLLSDAESTGLDLRPLAPLGLSAQDTLLAGLLEELFLRPGALVFWPSALALLAALARAEGPASALVVPAAAGLVLLSVGAALLVRRVVARLGSPQPGASLALIALRMALVLLPLAWALGALGSIGGPTTSSLEPYRPAFWMAAAVEAALAGDHFALLWGGGLLLVAMGLLLTAARLGPPEPRALRSRIPAPSPFELPTVALRIWRLPRVRLLLAQSLTAGCAVVILAAALASRGVLGRPVASIGACLVAWIVAGAPSAISANCLGAGGRAGAHALASAAGPLAWLLRSIAWIALPACGAAVVLAFLAAWVLGAPEAGWSGAALALGVASSGAGAGALVSTWWPWSTPLLDAGDPLWPPGPGRWMMPLAHALPLALAFAHLLDPSRFAPGVACGMIVLGGALVGGVGIAGASRLLARGRGRVVETLLS